MDLTQSVGSAKFMFIFTYECGVAGGPAAWTLCLHSSPSSEQCSRPEIPAGTLTIRTVRSVPGRSGLCPVSIHFCFLCTLEKHRCRL